MAVTMTSIKFKVTPEEAQPVSDPVSYSTVSGDFLSPHAGMQRNSLTGECSVRRRRPITLRIMPRLSLPGRSTSAPASVTEPDWSLASTYLVSHEMSSKHKITITLLFYMCTFFISYRTLYLLMLLRLINATESTFTYAFLVQLVVNLIICCFLGLVCIIMSAGPMMFARAFFYFAAVMIELGVFCVLGNEIMVQSSEIRDACYMSEWTDRGPLVRKTLFIIMERSKRPFALTAGNFVTLSYVTLIGVLRSAFSYFSVIYRLYTAHPQK